MWSTLSVAPGSSCQGPLHHLPPWVRASTRREVLALQTAAEPTARATTGAWILLSQVHDLSASAAHSLARWPDSVLLPTQQARGWGAGPHGRAACVSDRPGALLAPLEGVRAGRQDSRGRSKRGVPTPLSAQHPAHFRHSQHCHPKCARHPPTWCMSACRAGIISMCWWPR